MNDIVRVTGQDIRIAETMVCADDIFIWELNESTLEKNFKGVLLCKDFGLQVSLYNCSLWK
jgi:hypothetical protein